MNAAFFTVFARCFLLSFCLHYLEGWNYLNLHCRNNDHYPVDWWYIYKPPSEPVEFMSHGSNFSFITSEQAGRWQASEQPLTSHSMLQHTLGPLYRITYTDHLAYFMYEDWHPGNFWKGSAMKGVLMADKLGGVWMLHTISNFPDLNKRTPVIPQEESALGHLIVCFTLDLEAINEVVAAMKPAMPKVKALHIPPKLEAFVTTWKELDKPIQRGSGSGNTRLELRTRDETLKLAVRVRRPGDKRCLCHTFAKDKQIVLDVYGDRRQRESRLCNDEYSIRLIERISVKLKDSVSYVPRNVTDRAQFAVSTAAPWQRRGLGPPQYWTCVGNVNKGNDTRQAGMLVCADNFKVWSSFDNLKIKEPEC